jgi:hypothetical protein
MDRRTFSRYFGALTFGSGAFGHYSAAASKDSRADPFLDVQTFTQVGKEEQPFVERGGSRNPQWFRIPRPHVAWRCISKLFETTYTGLRRP